MKEKMTKEELSEAIDASIARMIKCLDEIAHNIGAREKEFVEMQRRVKTLEHLASRIIEERSVENGKTSKSTRNSKTKV